MAAEGTPIPEQRAAVEDSRWAGLFELADGAVHAFLRSVQQKGGPFPEVGHDLADDAGEVIGSAELAWPEGKIALLLSDEPPGPFTENGWAHVVIGEERWEEQAERLLAERIKDKA